MKRLAFLTGVLGFSVAALGVPPTIHLAWDETPPPQSPDDYVITTTDPDFPDIELVRGSLTWRVWSTDTDNTNQLGDIGVISSPHADNFAVSILNTSASGHNGARNVKGVVLDPTSANNCVN